MLLTTTENVPGKSYELLSLVTGCSVMTRNIGKDIGAGLRNLAGGEMKAYTELLESSKNKTIEHMIEQAERLGADAIVAIRFTSSDITQGGAELIATGTAVRFI